MKGMKGRLLKKLKLITSVGTLKQGQVLHHSPKHSPHKSKDLQDAIIEHQKDEKLESEHDPGSKGCPTPTVLEFEDTLAVAEQENQEDGEKLLSEFEAKCPQGGEDSVVFYTTSLRGVRKTSEACRKIRFLLENHKVSFRERDVSMDSGFRGEMWRLLGRKVTPPRLFIKGRYIGGADEVVTLNECGKLKKLLKDIPLAKSTCKQCENERFLICSTCNGSSRVFIEEEGQETWKRCTDCNENGLVKCSICS